MLQSLEHQTYEGKESRVHQTSHESEVHGESGKILKFFIKYAQIVKIL